MARALDLLGEFPVPTIAGAVVIDGRSSTARVRPTTRSASHRSPRPITAWAILDRGRGGHGRARRRGGSAARRPACARCDICSPTRAATGSTDLSRSSAPNASGSTPTPVSRWRPSTSRPRQGCRSRNTCGSGCSNRSEMHATSTHGVSRPCDVVDRRRRCPVHPRGHDPDADLERHGPLGGSSPLPVVGQVSFRAWDVSTRARGEWGSRSVGTRRRTGPGTTTPRRPSVISVARAR